MIIQKLQSTLKVQPSQTSQYLELKASASGDKTAQPLRPGARTEVFQSLYRLKCLPSHCESFPFFYASKPTGSGSTADIAEPKVRKYCEQLDGRQAVLTLERSKYQRSLVRKIWRISIRETGRKICGTARYVSFADGFWASVVMF